MSCGKPSNAALFAVLLLCLAIMPIPTACGQEAHILGDAEEKTYQLDAVTVTAQKKEENVQDVPESISVISSLDIEDAHLTDTSQIHTVVPNFMSYGNNNPAVSTPMFNMRGLGNLYEGDSAVSIYIDDIPITDPAFFSFPLDNIERIEVLRGPQGTLYGMNTEGGVVNIVTRQPEDAFEGSVDASYGSNNTYRVTGAVRGPLVRDKLSFGLSLLTEETDGCVENKYNGSDINGWKTFSGNANLLWRAAPVLDIQLNLAANSNDDGNFIWLVKDRDAYNAIWGTDLGEHDVNVNDEGFAENESDRESIKIAYTLPWATLVSVTSRIARSDDVGGDLDQTPMDYMSFSQYNDKEEYSQEIRLVSPDEQQDLSWIVGGFFSSKDSEYKQVFDFGNDFFMPYKQVTNASYDNETYAAFGQSTLRLMDCKLGITAGLRYEHAVRSIERNRYYTMYGMDYAIDNPLLGAMASEYGGVYALEESFDSFLPRIVLDYRLSPAVMTYASAARGYKAGGFSTISNNPDISGYDPEYAWTYEVGVKSRFLDNQLLLNLSSFYTDVEDYQDRIVVDNVVTMKNAAKAEIWGAEAELKYRPVAGLDLTATLGLLQAEYDDYSDMEDGQAVRFDGNSIALVPDCQWSLSARYRFQSGIYLGGELTGVSKYYFTRENIERLSQEGYELVNVKAGYEAKRFDIYFYGKNLFDEYYFTQLSDATSYGVPGVYEVGNQGDPTSFGVMVKCRF